MDITLYFFKEFIVGRFHEISRNRRLGFCKPPLKALFLGRRHCWLRLHHQTSHHSRLLHHHWITWRNLAVLGCIKGHIVRFQKGFQGTRSLELGMDGSSSQKAFQLAASDFHKGRIEASDGLLFGHRRNNGTSPFRVQAFVEPQKVRISSQDGRKGHVVVGRPDVDAIRSVFVDSLRVLDRIRNRNITCGIFGLGTTRHCGLRILRNSGTTNHD
mmetsp:Transcript_9249/g.19215  ORF Transcript_9249/g.19215 Transcript_9249/m.19215 type:complete len:214 (-) Transcript_9249:160-801(-)